MPAKVGYLVIDAADPAALARFWCGLLAVTVDTEIGDGEFLVLSPAEDGLTVGFQRVADAKLGKNRVHLDLVVDDLDQSTAEIEKLGGRWWHCDRRNSTSPRSAPPGPGRHQALGRVP
jgi:Glyoxalase-like domain